MHSRPILGILPKWLLLAPALLALSGCLKQKMLVSVNPDGSGLVVVTRVFSSEAVAMAETSFREMRRRGGEFGPMGQAGATNDPFYSEAKLKLEGRMYGPGVEFVKGRKINRNGARGSVAVYRFKDISQVRIAFGKDNAFMMMASPAIEGLDGDDQETMLSQMDTSGDAILFSFTKGDPGTLKIQMPPGIQEAAQEAAAASPEPADEKKDATPAAPEEDEEDADPEAQAMGMAYGFTGRESEADMARKSLKGMRISVIVEAKGAVVACSAGHRQKDHPQRLTLYDLDFDRIMASPRFDAVIREGQMGGPDDAMSAFGKFAGIPGATFETNREVVVQFK